jgi:hypothetical protein
LYLDILSVNDWLKNIAMDVWFRERKKREVKIFFPASVGVALKRASALVSLHIFQS